MPIRLFVMAYFNSRAHVERDEQGADVESHTIDFNSRAHVERDNRH